MTPRPFSASTLDTFLTCPRQYEAKHVTKTAVDDRDATHLVWGNHVHKAFEMRVGQGAPLPDALAEHESLMAVLASQPGDVSVEKEIAFNRHMRPTGFFAPDVVYRGKVDYLAVNGPDALIVDYKTGKPGPKWRQLELNACWLFNAMPNVQRATLTFYWTRTRSMSKRVMTRDEWPTAWAKIAPDVIQFANAHIEDIWPARRSGLCRAHCPALTCEFNGRAR